MSLWLTKDNKAAHYSGFKEVWGSFQKDKTGYSEKLFWYCSFFSPCPGAMESEIKVTISFKGLFFYFWCNTNWLEIGMSAIGCYQKRPSEVMAIWSYLFVIFVTVTMVTFVWSS